MTVKRNAPVFGLAVASLALAGFSAAAESETTGAPDGAPETVESPKFEIDHVSCTGAPNEIRLKVNNVDKSLGLMNAEIYRDNQETFLRYRGRVQTVRFAAKAPLTAFCMKAPEPGEYAIVVYHDKNASGDFDRLPIGLPIEPWGLSNDPKVGFSKPDVKDALFDVPEAGVDLEIRLR
ncbi:MAG: DUF2141 domain-containing protein [Pseudomonadota bacterium]